MIFVFMLFKFAAKVVIFVDLRFKDSKFNYVEIEDLM